MSSCQENGAMVPNAFKSVLFLDVFGWVSRKGRRVSLKLPGDLFQGDKGNYVLYRVSCFYGRES